MSRGIEREGVLASIARSLKAGFSEVWSNTMGRVGIIIISFIMIMSIYALATSPPNVSEIWDDPYAWSAYPRAVPPEWVKYLGVPVAEHRIYEDPELYFEGVIIPLQGRLPPGVEALLPGQERIVGQLDINTLFGYAEIYLVEYELAEEAFPRDIFILLEPINNSVINVEGREVTVNVIPIILVERPDGVVIVAHGPIRAVPTTDLRQLTADLYSFWGDYVEYFGNETGIVLDLTETEAKGRKSQMIFGLPETEKTLRPLMGEYRVALMLLYLAPGVNPELVGEAVRQGVVGYEDVTIIVKGNAYGLLGTDTNRRDLWLALKYGFPVAVAVGLFAAVSSVIIGLIIGVVSGYYGGIIDEVVQRVIDVIVNIPLLPILILIGVILEETTSIGPWQIGPWSKLFIIIGFLVVLSWGGLAIIVRSMTLSIKAEPYIEAAVAVGASNLRIIFRHIIPQILPYAMASLVFSVPAAIITEAGLSVIGIEHGLPTWGRVLADAQAERGVAYEMWWWILPPGIMLAVTSLAFVLLGLAIETIVEPRLRRS